MTRTVQASAQYFLRADAKLELLTLGWYAWPHLISPVQHAMNIAFRHIPLLESFVANPAVHAAAVQDPNMLGAPFIDIEPARVADVRALLEETLSRAAPAIRFAQALRETNRRLPASASGYSMDSEYDRLPAELRGLVELTYDTNNSPKLRVQEELACRQEELDDSSWQEVRVSDVRDVDRKFFLTTPRLANPDSLQLKIALADPRLDALTQLRTSPMTRTGLGDVLELDGSQRALLERFLTEEPPVRLQPDYSGTGVRVRYFGHACVLVQSAESSVLVDPLTAWERESDPSSLTFSDLPDNIDYAVLSHCHMDHCCPEMIVQLRRRVGTWVVPRNTSGEIADPSMKLILNRLGCANVRVVDPFDTIALPDGEIVSLPFPGEHCSLDIASKHSLAVNLRGRSFLFLVDSDAVDAMLYRRLARFMGHPDALFIGMECYGAPLSWFYGPLLGKATSRRDDESRRGNASNGARAWQAIENIDCDSVFVYAMGNQSWNRYLLGLEYTAESVQIVESDKFVEICRRAGRHAERLSRSRELVYPPRTSASVAVPAVS